MPNQPQDDDLIVFVDEQEHDAQPQEQPKALWRVMIIDDDADVHQATQYVLRQQTVMGRPVQLLHAYSGHEAKALLVHEHDLAVILLDVVMESENAGLELVSYIRGLPHLANTRIVLRTGQPGYAPEQETILRYDINDYKTKSELTHLKLLTTMTTSVRSYQQLCTIDANRRGLEMIVQASAWFMDAQGINEFAKGVITQMAGLLGVDSDGIVCALQDVDTQAFKVLAAAGQYAELINQPLQTLQDSAVRARLARALSERANNFDPSGVVLYLGQHESIGMAAYIATNGPLKPGDQDLLNVFCTNLSASLRNVTLVERLRYQAFFDDLLNLPNRNHFISEIDAAMARGAAGWAAALVDVDDFNGVNNLMGHVYGDRLLKALSRRLRETLGEEIMVARISGNAFGLLGPMQGMLPSMVEEAVQEPLVLDDHPHKITVTCGYLKIEGAPRSGVECLKDLNIALKQAKRHARGHHVFFNPKLGYDALKRAKLLKELHNALTQQHLFMMFQPQISLTTNELTGIEALMRWRSNDGKLVPPDEFIPIAEQSGLMVALGEWALNTACATMRELIDLGIAPHRIAVNVSMEQFKNPLFAGTVLEALDRNGLAGDRLELEITESVAMLNPAMVESVLLELRQHGISIAIDDFGTGYSSLAHLERLPLDRLKIDKVFVRQLGQEGAPRIAEMITELADTLGLRVVGEGIEDAASWQALSSIGCHEGQGYHIAKPMEQAQLLNWLQTSPILQRA